MLYEFAANSVLVDQLEHWLKEVDVESCVFIDCLKERQSLRRFIAAIANETAHDGPVLLFHVCLVILFVRPRPGEGNLLFLAVAVEVVVDESGIIIRVDTQERKRQSLTQEYYACRDLALATIGQGQAFSPAGGHVHSGEGIDIFAVSRITTVGDKVDLHEASRASSHSVEVRMRMACLSNVPGLVVLKPRRGLRRSGRKHRSIVARLIFNNDCFVSGDNTNSP